MTEGYHETKEVTTRLKEPYKIKLVPFAKGYQLEVTANLNSSQIDSMLNPDSEIVQLIENGKKLITETLKAPILIIDVEKELDGVRLQKEQRIKRK